ncbi:MAG: lyase family protein, partial [Neofamilia sp.]
MDYRIERDSLGEVRVPVDKYWGAQTQRSLENFKISSEKMPIEIIRAFAVLKKAAARTNFELGLLDEKITDTIDKVTDEIIDGKLDEH